MLVTAKKLRSISINMMYTVHEVYALEIMYLKLLMHQIHGKINCNLQKYVVTKFVIFHKYFL